MPEFEIVTGFYTIVPWLAGGILIFGIVATVGLAILMGWWIGKSPKSKSANILLGLGWIPLFGIFMMAAISVSIIYSESRSLLRKQIETTSGIHVITLIRDDTTAFVGKKDDKLMICRLVDKEPANDIYVIKCPDPGKEIK